MKKEPIHVKGEKPQDRITDFREVVGGYAQEEALAEAARCLQCKDPTCIAGCPVNIDIKTFIAQLARQEYRQAYFTIKEKNNFPSICGRVCPAEYQCRKACVLTKKDALFAAEAAINIHFLERFVGDHGRSQGWEPEARKDAELSRYKVAVVGSGPAGLCCAGELARHGVQVTIFEGLHKTGGVLRYGIPPFRLPHAVMDGEIDYLAKLGVRVVLNTLIGPTKSLAELFEQGFSAVFLGLGAGMPSFLGLPGENLCNIYSANEFLTRVNLMGAYKFPEFHTPVTVGRHIVVIGGGNTAMDAARVALRLQKIQNFEPDVTVMYRRTENEMPARRLEIAHAKEEGVKFEFLIQPQAFTGNQEGAVATMQSLRCQLGEPDASGRRRPVIIPNSDFSVPCDEAVVAVGLKANQVLIRVTPQIKTDKYGDIVVDPQTMQASLENVYAGGDIVGGEGTVIEAMGMAKRAASSIIARLRKKKE